MFQLLCGGLAASGGGIAATTLGVFNPDWRLSTPPILFTGLLGCLDFLAGSAAAGVFGVLTASHPAYLPWIAAAKSFVSPAAGAIAPNEKPTTALMTVLGARSVVVLFLSAVYATRAFMLHWYPMLVTPRAVAVPVGAGAEGEKSAREATRVVLQGNGGDEKKRV